MNSETKFGVANFNYGTHENHGMNHHRMKPTERMTPYGVGRMKTNEQLKINN